MITKTIIKPDVYYDSVRLMNASAKLEKMKGVDKTSIIMGTSMNKQILELSGLLTPEATRAKPSDLIIVIQGQNPDLIESALSQIDDLFKIKSSVQRNQAQKTSESLQEGLQVKPDTNIVLISTPGMYAATEGYKALMNNLNVFMFSNNVSLEDENLLKDLAINRNLLMMGPDCGTAIINGVPFGFANSVSGGPVGVVGASGTGIQEVTSLIHRFGSGISQAIGVGSRDLSEPIGGKMTLFALEKLANDKNTKVITLISKSSTRKVVEVIVEKIKEIAKPVVVLFLGEKAGNIGKEYGINQAITLDQTALLAVKIASGTVESLAEPPYLSEQEKNIVEYEKNQKAASQKHIKGLFSGGTFCSEAQVILDNFSGKIWSNVPYEGNIFTAGFSDGGGHTLIDLGTDEFTVGKPHPMIDFRTRIDALRKVSNDSNTSVVLIDVVLGFGAHPNPADALALEILKAKEEMNKLGCSLTVIVSVCGTDQDLQNRQSQVDKLEKAGAIVMESNAQAARLARSIIRSD